MTHLDRLVAATRGREVDQKPVVIWSESPGHRADAVAVGLVSLEDAKRNYPDQAVLAEVYSPLARAIRHGIPLNDLLHDDPTTGQSQLQELKAEAKHDMQSALERGADGIFYRLDGAYPAVTTPMQYGGYYLETDRELLNSITQAHFNLLNIEGTDPEIYLGFVSDLPAHAFAWDSKHTKILPSAIREMRQGALATNHPEADILFVKSIEEAEELLKQHAANHS